MSNVLGGGFKSYLNKIWDYREFVKNDTLAKLKIRHKGTTLGYLWWLLDPLLFMGIYILIVQIIFKRGGPDYPLFVFLALLSWRWFSSTLNDSSNSIRIRERLIKEIYFPKIILPLSFVFANIINFSFGLILLFIVIIIFKVNFTIYFLFFPLIVLIQLLFTMGLSLIVAHLTVFFKDISNILRYSLQIWFFLSPGIYSSDLIPDKFNLIYSLNPFYTLFNSYRDSIMYAQLPNLFALGIIFIVSLALIFIGAKIISKSEGNYAKIL
tara:strand:- start:5295 stop:6095 length:801 start_codon:yes stop_codon:yes gene_type:complete